MARYGATCSAARSAEVFAAQSVSGALVAGARVALALPDQARPDFTRAVYRAEFAEGRDIADRALIAEILRELGHDAEAVLAKTGEPAIKDKLRTETEEAVRCRIFGAPSFITEDGELFWGNDRLEQALDWARGKKS